LSTSYILANIIFLPFLQTPSLLNNSAAHAVASLTFESLFPILNSISFCNNSEINYKFILSLDCSGVSNMVEVSILGNISLDTLNGTGFPYILNWWNNAGLLWNPFK